MFPKQTWTDDDMELPSFQISSQSTFFADENATSMACNIYNSTATTAVSGETGSDKKRKASIVILEDEDIEEFQGKQTAGNTKKGTEVAIRRFEAWYHERYGEEINLPNVNKTNASYLLKHFFLEIRDTRKDRVGEEYEPSTLQTYRNGLRRYFLERNTGEKFDIGEDEDLKKKLASKKKQLKSKGKGNRPNEAHPLDDIQIEKLWETGAIGLKTPRQILHLVWWNNTRMLGMRGRQEQLNCQIQDFTDRGTFYEYTERSTKTRNGENENPKSRRKYNNKIFRGNGDERDPYLALKLYLSHRPKETTTFYLQPIDNPKGNIWYKTLSLKRDGLGNIMKRMSEIAGIQNEGNFTNSSGRKTAIQSLRGHFDPLTISELTGHANPTSIQSYSHNSLETQKMMFEKLAYSHSGAIQSSTSSVVNTYSHSSEKKDEHVLPANLLSNSTLNNCRIQINLSKT